MTEKHTNNRMQEEPYKFGLRYGNQENIKKAEWISKMTKELEGLEESPKTIYSKQH